jgi:site-specific DNA recombinase
MPTAIAYIRVSDPRQVEDGNSLASQEKLIRQHAANKAYELQRVFIERGESAKTDQRSVLKEMIEFCRQRKSTVNVLLVPKIDRLARNSYDYANIKIQLSRFGVRVESVGEHLEDSPVGRFTEGVLAAVAQFDNEIRAERCKGGMLDAVSEGRWMWKAPFGFRNIRMDGKGNIEPDPFLAPIVAEVFQKLASGHDTLGTVRQWLTSKGVKISRAQLHRIVWNKAYIGVIRAFGQEFPAAAPFVGVVSERTLLRAQCMVERPLKVARTYDRENPDFPLRGTLRCLCGKALTANWSQGQTARYPYYRCMTCRVINLQRDEVEKAFIKELNRFQPMGIGIGQFAEKLRQEWALQNRDAIRKHVESEAEIAKLRDLQKKISVKNALGIIPDSIAKDQIEELNSRILSLEGEERSGVSSGRDAESAFEYAVKFLRNLGDWWAEAPLHQKKKLQVFLYPRGVVYTKTGGFRTHDYPLLEELKRILGGVGSHLVDPSSGSQHLSADALRTCLQLGQDVKAHAYDSQVDPVPETRNHYRRKRPDWQDERAA